MAQILTVFPEQPSHRQRVTLDGVVYELRLTWRDRPHGWFADLWAANGDPIWLGQRVSASWGLGLGLGPEGSLPGVLYVRGPSGYNRHDLGDTLQLVYYPEAELPTLESTDQPLTITVP